MKAVVNHMAAISVLGNLPNVNPDKIGCIGHSLGGVNTLFSTFFDHRIKTAVISAGLTTFKRYAETSETGDLSKWSLRNKYMPSVKTKYNNDHSKMPFDFPELLASLKPKPFFVSAPKNDEIFDYLGALQCVEYAVSVYSNSDQSDKIEYVSPNTNHDFLDNIRNAAYSFLHKTLNRNGN